MAHILVIEDDTSLASAITMILEHASHQVTHLPSGEGWADAMEQAEFDLIVTDMFMPDKDGLETIREIRKAGHTLPILAISGGSTNFDALELAGSMGATDALSKPFGYEGLVSKVNALLEA